MKEGDFDRRGTLTQAASPTILQRHHHHHHPSTFFIIIISFNITTIRSILSEFRNILQTQNSLGATALKDLSEAKFCNQRSFHEQTNLIGAVTKRPKTNSQHPKSVPPPLIPPGRRIEEQGMPNYSSTRREPARLQVCVWPELLSVTFCSGLVTFAAAAGRRSSSWEASAREGPSVRGATTFSRDWPTLPTLPTLTMCGSVAHTDDAQNTPHSASQTSTQEGALHNTDSVTNECRHRDRVQYFAARLRCILNCFASLWLVLLVLLCSMFCSAVWSFVANRRRQRFWPVVRLAAALL